jgi:hypothetical protein
MKEKGKMGVILKISNSKNTVKAILRKMGRLYYMIGFSVLIKVTTLVCYFLVITYQEFGRPIFLKAFLD